MLLNYSEAADGATVVTALNLRLPPLLFHIHRLTSLSLSLSVSPAAVLKTYIVVVL